MATDVDPEQTLSYTVFGGTGENFFFTDLNNGVIKVRDNVTFDFETAPEMTLTVAVTDTGTPAITTHVTHLIKITDQNESPSIPPQTFSINENPAPLATVGTVSVDDPDAVQGQNFSFLATGGSGLEEFVIDSETGRISLREGVTLNFEDQQEYSLDVQVWDGGEPSLSASQQIFIAVLDVNDKPVVTTEVLAVPENSTGEVGQIEVSDQDAGQTHTFELIGAPETSVVEVSTDGVVSIRPGVHLNFEDQIDYEFLVRVTDNGAQPKTATVAIPLLVDNVAEAPEVIGQVDTPTATTGEQFEFTLPDGIFNDVDGLGFTLQTVSADEGFPHWLHYDQATNSLSGIPTSFFAGSNDVSFKAFNPDTPDVFSLLTFQVTVERNETPFHNDVNSLDVNGDGVVSAIDALRIINFLNLNGGNSQIDLAERHDAFFDVSNNSFVSAIDALQVINGLNSGGVNNPEAESVELSWISEGSSEDDFKNHDPALQEYLQESDLF